MQDFEAAELYSDGVGHARVFSRELALLEEQLKTDALIITSSYLGSLTVQEAQALVEELREALTIAIQKANLYADVCGKPKLPEELVN